MTISDDRYLEPHQARRREPTHYESLLGDSIEHAFASGIQDLPGLVAYLNQYGPASAAGVPWTEELYRHEMHVLGA